MSIGLLSFLGDNLSSEEWFQDLVFDRAEKVGLLGLSVDCDGRYIRRQDYGKHTEYGWQIDHIRARALGGGDNLDNLRPRHWRGNAAAGGILGVLMERGRHRSAPATPAFGADVCDLLRGLDTQPPRSGGLDALLPPAGLGGLLRGLDPQPTFSSGLDALANVWPTEGPKRR